MRLPGQRPAEGDDLRAGQLDRHEAVRAGLEAVAVQGLPALYQLEAGRRAMGGRERGGGGKWVFGPRIYKHEALTAIDALKEKS